MVELEAQAANLARICWESTYKTYRTGFDGFVATVSEEAPEIPTLEKVLKGRAVELYLADGDRLFIVADEEDAAKLGEARGLSTPPRKCSA